MSKWVRFVVIMHVGSEFNANLNSQDIYYSILIEIEASRILEKVD